MPLPTPCLFCYSFLPFSSGCILGKKTMSAFSSLSQNPLMQEPCLHRGPSCSKGYHLSNQVRQWRVGLLLGCGFGTWDGRSTSSFLPGKVRTGGFWPHLETENTEAGSKFLHLTVSLHPRFKKESVPPCANTWCIRAFHVRTEGYHSQVYKKCNLYFEEMITFKKINLFFFLVAGEYIFIVRDWKTSPVTLKSLATNSNPFNPRYFSSVIRDSRKLAAGSSVNVVDPQH